MPHVVVFRNTSSDSVASCLSWFQIIKVLEQCCRAFLVWSGRSCLQGDRPALVHHHGPLAHPREGRPTGGDHPCKHPGHCPSWALKLHGHIPYNPMLHLLPFHHQCCVVRQSFWKPWLDVMPDTVPSSLSFSEAEMAELEVTPTTHI